MLTLLPVDTLREILAYYALSLFTLRATSKKLKEIIDDQSTRRYLFVRWYKSSILPENLSLNQLISAELPGSECWFEPEVCLKQACRNADVDAIRYFKELVRINLYDRILLKYYARDHTCLTNKQASFYMKEIEGITHNDHDGFKTNLYIGMASSADNLVPFTNSIIRGFICSGRDFILKRSYDALVINDKIHIIHENFASALSPYHHKFKPKVYNKKNIDIIRQFNILCPFDLTLFFCHVLPYEEIMAIIIRYQNFQFLDRFCQELISSKRQPSFESYVLANHSDLIKRMIKEQNYTRRTNLVVAMLSKGKLSSQLILKHLRRLIFELEDRDLYDKFVNRFVKRRSILVSYLKQIKTRVIGRYKSKPLAHLRLNKLIN